jgi:hypothetical protein
LEIFSFNNTATESIDAAGKTTILYKLKLGEIVTRHVPQVWQDAMEKILPYMVASMHLRRLEEA